MIKRTHWGWTLALTVFITLAGQPLSVGMAGQAGSLKKQKPLARSRRP